MDGPIRVVHSDKEFIHSDARRIPPAWRAATVACSNLLPKQTLGTFNDNHNKTLRQTGWIALWSELIALATTCHSKSWVPLYFGSIISLNKNVDPRNPIHNRLVHHSFTPHADTGIGWGHSGSEGACRWGRIGNTWPTVLGTWCPATLRTAAAGRWSASWSSRVMQDILGRNEMWEVLQGDSFTLRPGRWPPCKNMRIKIWIKWSVT